VEKIDLMIKKIHQSGMELRLTWSESPSKIKSFSLIIRPSEFLPIDNNLRRKKSLIALSKLILKPDAGDRGVHFWFFNSGVRVGDRTNVTFVIDRWSFESGIVISLILCETTKEKDRRHATAAQIWIGKMCKVLLGDA
jgi:hypothetical protein